MTNTATKHEDREIANRVLEDQRFALQRALHARRQNLLCARVSTKLRCWTDRVTRLQVEEHGHAGELVDVIHGLRPDHRMPTRHRIERNHALSVITLDVELAEVFRAGALVVGHFQDDLVLIGRLLDQVAVVLRVGVVQKRENSRLGNSIQLRLVAQNIDLQVWRVIVEVRVHEQEIPDTAYIFAIILPASS